MRIISYRRWHGICGDAAVLITTHIVEPRLGKYTGKGIGEEDNKVISEQDYNALKYGLWSMVIFIAIIGVGMVSGILSDPVTGSALSGKAPFIKSLAFIIALMFFIPGVVFGKVSGKFKNCQDVAKAMGKAMSDMGTYIAIRARSSITFMIQGEFT
ncbi:MAG: AbgT family transporter [Sporomusa sp.]